MSDRDNFLAWMNGELRYAEFALHDGDAEPRRRLWSRNEPVSVLGAWRSAFGQAEVDALFAYLAATFSSGVLFDYELLACEVVGDMAYTACLEHTTTMVDGAQRVARRRRDSGTQDRP